MLTCPNECAGPIVGSDAEGFRTCGYCCLEWLPEQEDWS